MTLGGPSLAAALRLTCCKGETRGGMVVSTYRAALCEDEAAERQQLAQLCREAFAGLGVKAEVVSFPSADTLLAEEAGGDGFDLYLLDIQMAGTTGLELARQLYGQGVRDRIIFITGNPEYALEGYDVQPLHYLIKPVGRERLEEALRRALERRGPRTALFRWGGKAVAIPVQEIRWIESRDHGVVVCLGDREQAFPLPLTEAERLVPAWMFRRCHKSYLVNLEWVDRLIRSEVILRDGQRLPVSRTYCAEFQSALVCCLNQ